jgi:hypothetical protein
VFFLKNRPGHGRLFDAHSPIIAHNWGLRKPVLADYLFKKKKKPLHRLFLKIFAGLHRLSISISNFCVGGGGML